jgi:hypothetical protein
MNKCAYGWASNGYDYVYKRQPDFTVTTLMNYKCSLCIQQSHRQVTTGLTNRQIVSSAVLNRSRLWGSESSPSLFALLGLLLEHSATTATAAVSVIAVVAVCNRSHERAVKEFKTTACVDGDGLETQLDGQIIVTLKELAR